MKKWIALFMTLMIVVAFSACGGKDEKEPTSADGNTSTEASVTDAQQETTLPDEPAADDSLAKAAWSNKTGSFELRVVGASLFDDEDGEKSIRVYLDFTNMQDSYTTSYADEKKDVVLTQDGVELDDTDAVYGEDVTEYGNDKRNIRPGVTIRVIEQYTLVSETAAVKFVFTAPNQDADIIHIELDPATLPGAPAEALTAEPIAAPDFNAGWPESGKCTDYYDREVQHDVAILDAQFVESVREEKLIRVSFTFTNNGDDETELFEACDLRVFQDGIQLAEGQAKEVTDSDRLFYDDADPGQSVTVSNTYILLSDSPVEVEVNDTWADSGMAKLFAVE